MPPWGHKRRSGTNRNCQSLWRPSDNYQRMAISSRRSLVEKMTRQEIEQKMDELARKYRESHDSEIPEEIYRLARQLMEMDH
jgi:hypothetical protein